jgi:hypothetical protein
MSIGIKVGFFVFKKQQDYLVETRVKILQNKTNSKNTGTCADLFGTKATASFFFSKNTNPLREMSASRRKQLLTPGEDTNPCVLVACPN